jgi:hypothetical protein
VTTAEAVHYLADLGSSFGPNLSGRFYHMICRSDTNPFRLVTAFPATQLGLAGHRERTGAVEGIAPR